MVALNAVLAFRMYETWTTHGQWPGFQQFLRRCVDARPLSDVASDLCVAMLSVAANIRRREAELQTPPVRSPVAGGSPFKAPRYVTVN